MISRFECGWLMSGGSQGLEESSARERQSRPKPQDQLLHVENNELEKMSAQLEEVSVLVVARLIRELQMELPVSQMLESTQQLGNMQAIMTQSNFSHQADELFDQIDVNGDGVIDRSELDAALRVHCVAAFSVFVLIVRCAQSPTNALLASLRAKHQIGPAQRLLS